MKVRKSQDWAAASSEGLLAAFCRVPRCVGHHMAKGVHRAKLAFIIDLLSIWPINPWMN